MSTMTNPLVQGLMAGIQMRNMIETARRQREELDMRRQQIEDTRQERQRQAELQDLQTRLALSTNPALEEVAGDQDVRTVKLAPPAPDIRDRMLMPYPSEMKVPVETGLEYKGRKYAIKGPQERLSEDLRRLQVIEGAKKEIGTIPYNFQGQTFRLPPSSVASLENARTRDLVRQDKLNKPAASVSTRLGVGTDWTSGNITPYKVTLDENGKPVILTGEPARGIARSKTGKGKTSPDKSIKFRSIETKKNTAMRAAWNTYELTKNTDPIAAQKRDISIQKAQGDYENAIVAAGGSIGPTTPRSRPPLSSFERR